MVFSESQSSTFWFQPIWGPHACAQPEVTNLHLGGDPGSIEELKDRYQIVMHTLRRSQDPAPCLHCCLFLHSLTPLMIICPVELREGLESWTVFPTNKGGFSTQEDPHRVLLSFNPLPPFFILLHLERKRSKTRKGITFLVDRLISAEELALGGLSFTSLWISRWDGAHLPCVQIKEQLRWLFEVISACPSPNPRISCVVKRTRVFCGGSGAA